MRLAGECSFGPIEEAVRSGIRTVHIVTTLPQRPTVKPNGPLIRNMVSIRISKLPDVRRCSDVDRSVVNKDTFGERHVVREHCGLIKHTISVSIDKPQDAMSRIVNLHSRFSGVPGAVGDVKNSVHIKAQMNGTLHQWRCRNTLQFETVWYRERMRSERDSFVTVHCKAASENKQHTTGRAQRCVDPAQSKVKPGSA